MESGFTITAAGWRKLARMVAGDTLHITRVAVGKGVLPEETNPADLTDLVNPVADAASTQQLVNGLEVSFIVEYRNDMNGGLATGFWLTEFGVFVLDGDSEIMLYYATLGDYPEYVSAYGSGRIDVRRYPVAIVLSKELKVELDYPPMAFLGFSMGLGAIRWSSWARSGMARVLDGLVRHPRAAQIWRCTRSR